ncbi:uncharacterized protein LOC131020058 [Salvia miltiorrhiza]|uniref:uncharacterized protein LOC131020058 n=1 Tax=Salvia miltiorrhiza TaxID=226208 RepID=UPI0025AD91E7|nr:uncharacterized protein LOC131020058 [Salvia miltiorrhiza]
MGSRKRKPLSDITDIHNLTPLSVLRELVSSNAICKPPVSILRSNSNSTNQKFCPESSDRSNTSIGSSSVGATFNSKTVQFVSPTTSPAYSRRHNIEKCNKEREAHVIASSISIEKRKDKGKAISVPFRSSASEKMKENQSRICNMALTDGGMGIQNAAYDQRRTIEKSRKERKSDVIGCDTSVKERDDKGKAIAVPYNSLPTGKLKEPLNIICNSSTLVERSCQKGNLSFSNSSAENVKESDKDKLVSYSHSSGKTEKRKASLNSPDCALGKKSETGKDIADTSCFSLEKINDKNKGILKRTRSSIVQINETKEEYLSPSTSLVGGAKDRPKFVNITNILPDKRKGKGKVILEPSNIREPSEAVSVISRPSRKMKTSEKEKKNNVVGVSSCPPITRTKKLQNDLDEAGDVKYLNSWTDPQENVRKKRCSRTEKTSELPEEFIREQKAYYDDIDNFELPVEEVSQDELD